MTGGDDRRRPLSVVFYRAASGREPVREWLRLLSRPDRQSVGRDIKTVQRDWPLGMPLVRKMEPGLWELRSHLNGRIGRVVFTVVEGSMVPLHGFIKKSEKTPGTELSTARRRLAELRRGRSA